MRREPAAGDSPYFFFPLFFFRYFNGSLFFERNISLFSFRFCYFFFLYESEVVIRKRTKRPKGNNCLVHVTFAFLVFLFRAEVVRRGCASETERCICAASSYFVRSPKNERENERKGDYG